jgi:hypothetical protein
MKSRLVIIGLMICSVLAISVSAQRLTNIQQVVQDDRSGDHLIIFIQTGEYKFESCKGSLAISGVGKVSLNGCKLVLNDFSDNRRVVAEVDLCDKVGKADIVFGDDTPKPSADSVLEVVLSDSNTLDSAFDCTFKQVDPK